MTTQTRTAAEVAAEILADEAWFNALPPAMKDDLSQPNHNFHQARLAVELARLVQQETQP